jgi:hypothetical protein
MGSPADPTLHKLTLAIAGVARFQDLRDDLPFHHLSKLDGRSIRFGIVHPPAHVGVEREILCPQQKLAV